MIAQAADIVDRLLPHIFEESIISGVHTAGKHKVLPHQNPVAVAEFVEIIIFVYAAAPDTQHIHIGIDGQTDDPLVVGPAHPRQEEIIGYIVGPLHKDRHAIEFHIKRSPQRIRFAHQSERTQADGSCAQIHRLVICLEQPRLQLVEMGLSQAQRPPAARVFYKNRHSQLLLARLQLYELPGGLHFFPIDRHLYAVGARRGALDRDPGRERSLLICE